MEPGFSLRRLGLAVALLATTALLLASSALAWNTTVKGSGVILDTTVHVNDGFQTVDTCPTGDPAVNPATAEGEVGLCTHWIFTAQQNGVLTITLNCSSVPSSSGFDCGSQFIDAALCLENASTPASDPRHTTTSTARCPMDSDGLMGGTGETNVCNSTPTSTDPVTFVTTYTLTCPVEAGLRYELIIAPSPVDTCPLLDVCVPVPPLLTGGPGAEFHLTASFAPATSGTSTDGDEDAFVVGAGQSNDHTQKIAMFGDSEGRHNDRTIVYFERRTNDNTRCTFVPTTAP